MKRLLIILTLSVWVGLAGPAAADLKTFEANETWSKGTFAGTVNWDRCVAGHCEWFPFVVTMPIESPRCDGSELIGDGPSRDDTVIAWSGGKKTSNGTVAFSVKDVPIGRAGYGQRACLAVFFTVKEREQVCVVQAPIFGQDPLDCPLVIQYRRIVIQDSIMSVRKEMTTSQAKTIAKGLLARKYGRSWRRGVSKQIQCRPTASAFSCSARWKERVRGKLVSRRGVVSVPAG
jgi:hypothetical protein